MCVRWKSRCSLSWTDRRTAKSAAKSNVLRHIVALDQKRLLARLRSKHAPRSWRLQGRAPLLPILQRWINEPKSMPLDTLGARSEAIRLQIACICTKLKQLDDPSIGKQDQNHILECLVNIVEQSARIDVDILQSILRASCVIDVSLRPFIARTVSKLARYHQIARDFVIAAKGSEGELLQTVRIEVLERSDHEPLPLQMDYLDALSRFTQMEGGSHSERRPLASFSMIDQAFARRNRNRPRHKIHAEIQLLLYYEVNPSDSKHKPRVLCSSKDACYLCYNFIRLHGVFHTPSTHGRIYDSWTLPAKTSLQHPARDRISSAVERLNSLMEGKILQTMNRNARAFPHPNESTLFTWKQCSSTPTLKTLHGSDKVRSTAPSIQTVHSPQLSISENLVANGEDEAIPTQRSYSSRETMRTQSTVIEAAANEAHDLGETPTTYLFPDSQSTLTLHSKHCTASTSYECPSASSSQQTLSKLIDEQQLNYGIRASTFRLPAKEDSHSLLLEDQGPNIDYVDLRRLPKNGEEVTLKAGSVASSTTLALRRGRSVTLLKFVREN